MHERGVPQHAADNMVKVRVADLRFVAVAVTLLMLASLTTSSPVRRNVRASASGSPSWHNPCHVSSPSGKARRHAASRSSRVAPLITTLKNTRDNFHEEWEKAASMYDSIEVLTKSFDNLPSSTSSLNNKQERPPKGHPTQAIPKLHEDLQKFLIGMESMKETDDLLIKDTKIRRHFFREVSTRAKYLLCEVETFLNTTNEKKPQLQDEYDPCFEEFDKGTAVVLGCEKSFFKLYNSFLRDWNTIFDERSKNNSKRKGKRENKKVKETSRVGNRKRHNPNRSRSTVRSAGRL